jgi:hypothetical protein
MHIPSLRLAGCLWLCAAACVRAGVGDPQLRTDHPWYPGELAISTFDRLFTTEAEQYRRATGVAPTTELDRALASWFWRNTHYAHGEEGAEDLWGAGFGKGADTRAREYWTGLFAHGFGLCGTTHSQWTAEFEPWLGHARARGVGMKGHNSFEVFLTGGAFGEGRWALLDHDLSTVIFDPTGQRLLSAAEVQSDWRRWIARDHLPQKQHGWLVCGLHPDDGGSYARCDVAEYLPGYAGPPPMVHLRRGETLRRHFVPGLDDGRTFVFWGRNYKQGGIPGPERGITWVNQPEKMHGSRNGAGQETGRFRFGNAVYRYAPDFAGGDYREGVANESERHVTFEFCTPFIIGATPPNDDPWGIYAPGGHNGLVLHGRADCVVSVSADRGATWKEAGAFGDGLDLTDHVKGHRQYLLRFATNAAALKNSGLVITTVCQANPAVFPRLKDDGTEVRLAVSHRGVISAGPNRAQAQAHVIAGGFDTPAVTLEVRTPHDEPIATLYAAAHIASGNPPRPDLKFQIEYSTDGGRTWHPVVKDWTIARRGDEPGDFWSQSLCYGSVELPADVAATSAQVRFRNNGGKKYLRAEAHLVYRTPDTDGTRVTYAWTDATGPHQATNTFPARSVPAGAGWTVATAKDVTTRWVEMEPVVGR